MRRALPLCLMLSACAAAGGPYPSLQPRAAERIDPRVPVERPMNDRPANAALVERLASLVEQARSGDASFNAAASEAERLAAAAGPAQSESWIAAEEALSAAVAARKLVATAMGDIDEIGARALQTNGGIAPKDLQAIQRAAGDVAAIGRAQTERIDAIERRLAS